MSAQTLSDYITRSTGLPKFLLPYYTRTCTLKNTGRSANRDKKKERPEGGRADWDCCTPPSHHIRTVIQDVIKFYYHMHGLINGHYIPSPNTNCTTLYIHVHNTVNGLFHWHPISPLNPRQQGWFIRQIPFLGSQIVNLIDVLGEMKATFNDVRGVVVSIAIIII